MTRKSLFGTAALALSVTLLAAAPVPVTILAVVGDSKTTLTGRGEGECKHAPIAAIYGVRSAMWSVQYNDPERKEIHSLSFTLWRPLAGGGPDQVNIVLRTGAGQHRVSTVKGGEIQGSGDVVFKPNQLGGQFEFTGKVADGGTMNLRIVCPRITSLRPVGG